MSTVSVRYIVDDVDAAIAFYRDRLGFRELMHQGIGARQVMIEDPAGNPVELFEPLRAEARLST